VEYKEKDIISDLQEYNKLLLSKIEVYKEEITKLKNKLEYAQRFFVLYENIMENSRKENKQLTEKIKELENQIKLNKKD
jgi:predicted RNase H-like nuclease (RuvC/YqgF family)